MNTIKNLDKPSKIINGYFKNIKVVRDGDYLNRPDNYKQLIKVKYDSSTYYFSPDSDIGTVYSAFNDTCDVLFTGSGLHWVAVKYDTLEDMREEACEDSMPTKKEIDIAIGPLS